MEINLCKLLAGWGKSKIYVLITFIKQANNLRETETNYILKYSKIVIKMPSAKILLVEKKFQVV